MSESSQDAPMSLLILGCGYIGQAVAQLAIDRGWRVGAVTRNPAKAQKLREMGVAEVAEAQLETPQWAEPFAPGWQAALYAVSASERSEAGYRQAYVDLQRAQGPLLQRLGVRTYLYTGSTGIYPQSGGAWVDEGDSAAPGAPGHAGILAEAEGEAAEIGQHLGTWRILRIAGIYGPGRTYLLDLLKARQGVLPGSGDYFVNWAHRDDIANAALTMLEQPDPALNGPYNVSDGHPFLREEVANWLASRCGISKVRFDPSAAGARSRFRQGRDGHPPNRRIRNAHLRKAFGWAPRYCDFRAGYAGILPGK